MTVSRRSVWLMLIATFTFCLPFFFQIAADPDLWWHLASGVQFTKLGRPIYYDIFSYTAYGAPWINHEWLWEVFVGASFLKLGEPGLFFFRNCLFAVYIAALILAYRRLRLPTLLIPWMICLAIFYTSRYFILRPHAISYLFCVLFFLICDDPNLQNRKRFTRLALLMILWVNMHGGFLFGLGMLAVYLFDWIRLGTLSKSKALLVWLGIASLSLVTPYGVKLYPYLWKELSSSHEWISEWQPLFDQPHAGRLMLHYGIFTAIPLILFLIHRKSERLPLKMIWLITAILPLIHRRFFVLLVIFGSFQLAQEIGKLMPVPEMKMGPGPIKRPREYLMGPGPILGLMVIFSLFSLASAWKEFSFSKFHLRETQIAYPKQAVEFLNTHALGPNLALPVHWGGFAIWNLWPKYRVSIDGRNLTIYPKDYIPDQLAAHRTGNLKGFLGEPAPDVILSDNQSPIRNALHEDQNWKMVYQDNLASIFIPKMHGAEGVEHRAHTKA